MFSVISLHFGLQCQTCTNKNKFSKVFPWKHLGNKHLCTSWPWGPKCNFMTNTRVKVVIMLKIHISKKIATHMLKSKFSTSWQHLHIVCHKIAFGHYDRTCYVDLGSGWCVVKQHVDFAWNVNFAPERIQCCQHVENVYCTEKHKFYTNLFNNIGVGGKGWWKSNTLSATSWLICVHKHMSILVDS